MNEWSPLLSHCDSIHWIFLQRNDVCLSLSTLKDALHWNDWNIECHYRDIAFIARQSAFCCHFLTLHFSSTVSLTVCHCNDCTFTVCLSLSWWRHSACKLFIEWTLPMNWSIVVLHEYPVVVFPSNEFSNFIIFAIFIEAFKVLKFKLW